MALGIGTKRSGHSVALLHREAGAERSVTRKVDPANGLDRTAYDGPDEPCIAGRGRSTATNCPAAQGQR